MINKNELKAEIVRNGLTNAQLAQMLNMSPKTFSNKLNKGVFGTDEASKMIEILGIKNPERIFFANVVTL